MNLTLEQFGEANEIVKKIYSINDEIAAIDKLALLIANDENTIDLKLSIKKIVEVKKDANKIQFATEDLLDALRQTRFFGGSNFCYINYYPFDKKTDDNATLHQVLSTNCTLQILGILLNEKQTQKSLLLEKLQSLGFDIK